MNHQKQHQKLIQDYSDHATLARKLNSSGMLIQFGIISAIVCCQKIQIQHDKFVACILFFLSIYFFVKDFFIFRRVESHGIQIISKGIELEKDNGSIDNFFHDVLADFNLIKILSLRSFINMLSFTCLGYLLKSLILDANAKLLLTHWILITLCAGVLSTLACKFYYSLLKPLEKLQKTTLNTAIL